MATRSITYCDRCKNDVSLVIGGERFVCILRTGGFDLCGACYREFERSFLDAFRTHIPPTVPPL